MTDRQIITIYISVFLAVIIGVAAYVTIADSASWSDGPGTYCEAHPNNSAAC